MLGSDDAFPYEMRESPRTLLFVILLFIGGFHTQFLCHAFLPSILRIIFFVVYIILCAYIPSNAPPPSSSGKWWLIEIPCNQFGWWFLQGGASQSNKKNEKFDTKTPRQGGKMNRGLIVVETGVALMKHQVGIRGIREKLPRIRKNPTPHVHPCNWDVGLFWIRSRTKMQNNTKFHRSRIITLALQPQWFNKNSTILWKYFGCHRLYSYTRSKHLDSRAENQPMPTFIVLQCWVGLLSTFRSGRLGRRTPPSGQLWMNSCGWRVLLYNLLDTWVLGVYSMESLLICVCVISSLFLLVKLPPQIFHTLMLSLLRQLWGKSLAFVEACMLMADDMMDGSVTRRGNPCWYRRGIEQTTKKEKFKWIAKCWKSVLVFLRVVLLFPYWWNYYLYRLCGHVVMFSD